MPPLEEELRIDFAPALAGIDELDQALQAAAQSFADTLASAAEAVQVPVEPDVSTFSEEIEAAADEAAPVAVVDDVDASAVTEAIDTSADEASPVVVVDDVDASAVTEGIEAAGADAEVVASVSVDSTGIDETAAGLDTLASFGAGNVLGSLEGGLGKLGAAGAVAAAGVALVGGASTQFLDAAIEKQTALQVFQQNVGNLAGELQTINVGTLSSDIDELAISLGGSDENLRLATAGIVALARASGATDEQIVTTTEQIVALAARAVTLNPALGDVGSAATRLTSALASGRAKGLIPFRIALPTAQVAEMAAQIAGGAENVDLFDKIVASAAISADKLGPTLGDTVAGGAEIVSIQFAALTERMGELFEELGTPLIIPALDLLESFVPLMQPIGELISEIAQTALPVIANLTEALAPALEALIDPMIEVVQTFAPFAEELGEFAADILTALTPALSVIAESFAAVLTAGAPLLDALGPLLDIVGDLASALSGPLAIALEVILFPISLASQAIEGLGRAIAAALDVLANINFDPESIPGFGAIVGFIEDATGFDVPEIDLSFLGDTADAIRGSFDNVNPVLEEATGNFGALGAAAGGAAPPLEEVDQALANLQAVGASGLATGIGDIGVAFQLVAQGVATGAVTSAEGVQRLLGLPIDQAAVVFDTLKASIEEFADTAAETIPTTVDIIAGLPEEARTSVRETIDVINDEVANAATFAANLQTLLDQGFDDTVANLVTQGPERGAELAAALVGGKEGLRQEFEATVTEGAAGLTDSQQALHDIATQVGANTGGPLGEATNAAFGQSLNLTGEAQLETEALIGFLQQVEVQAPTITGSPGARFREEVEAEVLATGSAIIQASLPDDAQTAAEDTSEAFAEDLDLVGPAEEELADAVDAIFRGIPQMESAAGTLGALGALAFADEFTLSEAATAGVLEGGQAVFRAIPFMNSAVGTLAVLMNLQFEASLDLVGPVLRELEEVRLVLASTTFTAPTINGGGGGGVVGPPPGGVRQAEVNFAPTYNITAPDVPTEKTLRTIDQEQGLQVTQLARRL